MLAGLGGFSRVVTGAHYPGDVFAGFGIGAAIAVLGGASGSPYRRASLPATDPLYIERRPVRMARAWYWSSIRPPAVVPAPG